MRVVELDLSAKELTAESLKTIVGDGKAYTAECSTSPDGRTLLYTSLESGDGDLYAMDFATKKITRLTALTGYDGGAFFSPDGKKIVWRADRNADNLLQIFIADVVFDSAGAVVGIGEPLAVTNDGAVNWAPYFSPDGKVIVYASSRVGHDNYELLAVPVPTDRSAPIAQPRRVTHAAGADLLPAISRAGTLLMWTSQRGTDHSSQLWLANISQTDLLSGDIVPPVSESASTPVPTTTAKIIPAPTTSTTPPK
jgi:Tol biopolymer transport system component